MTGCVRTDDSVNNPCWSVSCGFATVCQIIEDQPNCVKIQCESDKECPDNLACLAIESSSTQNGSNKTCNDPCINVRCDDGTKCTVTNHQSNCSQVICKSDNECDNDKACFSLPGDSSSMRNNSTCNDLCNYIRCAAGTVCTVTNHQPTCAQIPTCKSDDDCYDDEACFSLTWDTPPSCNNPCTLAPCTANITCIPSNHKARCVNGTTCQSNDDCPDDETCSASLAQVGSKAVCYNPCANMVCNSDTQCTVTHHKPNCTKIPACKSNDECYDDEACFSPTWDSEPSCNNPCLQQRCTTNATCIPSNHQARCVNIITCESDDDCYNDEACFSLTWYSQLTCNNPCMLARCTSDSICVPSNHQGQCINGTICRSNEDCPDNETCSVSLEQGASDAFCYNPCVNMMCRSDTQCIVTQHEPSCTEMPSCKANIECEDGEACFEATLDSPKACNNPCILTQCKKCHGENHTAICG